MRRAGLGETARRAGLLLAAAALPVIAGCAPSRAPEWRSAAPVALSPSPAASSLAPFAEVPSSPSPSPPVTASASPSPATSAALWPSPSPSAGFVAAVRGQMPEVALDRRPEEITELGDHACQGLAAGKRPLTIAESLGEYGLSAPDASELVTLAGTYLCYS